MGPDVWVKLLFTYGPYALLVFFVVVGETRARSALLNAAINRKLTIPIYAANWCVIFTLLGFSLNAWFRVTFHSEYTIRGSLENLQGAEALVSDSPDLYLHKRYGAGGRFEYDWRVITQEQIPEGQKIPFTLQLGQAESEKVRDYLLPIHSSYYKEKIGLRYDRQKDKLILSDGTKDQELQPEEQVTRYVPVPSSLWVWKVEAQAAQQPVPLQERLESGDPIIRRQARKELSQQREQQWQYIESSLANDYSSYRVKLGVLTALSDNNCSDLSKLSAAALQRVALMTSDADATLRNLARRCLMAQPSPAVDAALDTARHEKQANPSNAGELAKTQLEVLYSLGIQAKDRYGSRRASDRTEIERAFAYFRKAWELRTLAGPTDQVVFAKALYGWGLALHDRSWIERGASNRRNPALVKAAQDKFSEFLTAIRAGENPQAYPYPQHVRRAEAYLKKPEPQSLQTN